MPVVFLHRICQACNGLCEQMASPADRFSDLETGHMVVRYSRVAYIGRGLLSAPIIVLQSRLTFQCPSHPFFDGALAGRFPPEVQIYPNDGWAPLSCAADQDEGYLPPVEKHHFIWRAASDM